MAKWPSPGRVKTRLCPPLDAERAARLAAAFLADTLATLLAVPGLEVRLALDQDGDEASARVAATGLVPELAAALERIDGTVGQGEGDLGARMRRVLALSLDEGARGLLVGADVPDLPASRVAAAFEALGRADAVLVPATDGGYVAVGAAAPLDSLFPHDAPWGRDGVLACTLASLAAARASVVCLDPWEDVDDAAALGRLASRTAAAPASVAPATRALLARWQRQGVAF